MERKAIRIRGVASIVEKNNDEAAKLVIAFTQLWAPYIDAMQNFVVISITHAELIVSPAYDLGLSASELRKINLEKLTQIASEANSG